MHGHMKVTNNCWFWNHIENWKTYRKVELCFWRKDMDTNHIQMHLKLLQTRKGQCVFHARAERWVNNGNSSKERAKINLKEKKKTLLMRPAKYWPRLLGCCRASAITASKRIRINIRTDINTVASCFVIIFCVNVSSACSRIRCSLHF